MSPIHYLDFLNENYPVRRSEEQKKAFREYIQSIFPRAVIETTADGKNQNIVIGDPLTAKLVCTAHYDTPAASLFPNLMIPRNKALFLLYQFAPIVLLLAAALGGGYLIASALVHPAEQEFVGIFVLVYMVIYYGLFYLMYRVFTNPNNYNDNTSGVAAVLSIAERLNEQQRGEVAFILFDNEEKGKKGSKAYCKDHKDAMKDRLLVNFDCVGNGEHIVFIAMKEAEGRSEYRMLQESFRGNDAFRTYFYPIKGSESNSDYKNFPCGIGCMACRKSQKGVLYTPHIHTPKDTVASNENIAFIAGGMCSMITALSVDGDKK